MAEKASINVSIRGQQFKIRTDVDEAQMHRVAGYLDETMAAVEERTGTVDSLGVALLTGLNLARELVDLRASRVQAPASSGVDDARLRALIDRVEAELSGAETA